MLHSLSTSLYGYRSSIIPRSSACCHSLCTQRRMAEVLESREAHYMVIGLVLLDLAIVLAELVLSSFYPTPELAPHLGA